MSYTPRQEQPFGPGNNNRIFLSSLRIDLSLALFFLILFMSACFSYNNPDQFVGQWVPDIDASVKEYNLLEKKIRKEGQLSEDEIKRVIAKYNSDKSFKDTADLEMKMSISFMLEKSNKATLITNRSRSEGKWTYEDGQIYIYENGKKMGDAKLSVSGNAIIVEVDEITLKFKKE